MSLIESGTRVGYDAFGINGRAGSTAMDILIEHDITLVFHREIVINLTLTSGLYRGACSRTIESRYIGEAIYEGEAIGRRRRGM